MIIKTVREFANYDDSSFGSPAPLFPNDEQIEEVWKRQHSLQEFLKPEKFKSYEVLESKLKKVLGTGGVMDDHKEAEARMETAERPKTQEKKVAPKKTDEDQMDDYFKDIIEDD